MTTYTILHSLGKGGMGEVFLAYDPLCKRKIALKQIRGELAKHQTIRDRFLKEARIAAQLIHPSIIPIYSINQDETGIYYTMPYVEGETLRQHIREAKAQEKEGKLPATNASIPSLMRVFLNVCQAVAYAHASGVIHRDLKPENIIVGKYGQVVILDWGLAQWIGQPEEPLEEISIPMPHVLTRPGKIVGTLAYMSPERASGEPPGISSDIYSLGVILYQILTLRLPFRRATLEEFLKQMKHERLIDPSEAAPHRDIPRHLASIAKKCLASSEKERYQSMEELLKDVETYIEGRPEWLESTQLTLSNKEDWEFQENVFLSNLMEWVSLMISKASFQGNVKIETSIRLKSGSQGIGFLLNVASAEERKSVEEGYSLWIGSKSEGTKLFRSHVEVMHLPDFSLQEDQDHKLRIEKVDHHVRLFVDDVLKMSYPSHIPLWGTQIGVFFRDANFELEPLKVFVGSQNVMVNCLSIPDAFLANKNFSKALAEYRRISACFPGHTEGREATFRAGITLLEKASTKERREEFLQMALDEFEKLHGTPGAPLEYLGKSLVYKQQGEPDEEIKCLELAIRKFVKHPLRNILIEHISLRLNETYLRGRRASAGFTLLALRHLPQLLTTTQHQQLEPLPFIHQTVALAFWLGKRPALEEMLEDPQLAQDAKHALSVLENGFPLPKTWLLVKAKKWNDVELVFKQTPPSEEDLSYFLFGCFLAATLGEKEALDHFSLIEEIDFPPTHLLAVHYLTGKIGLEGRWFEESFFWERVQLLHQLILFYQCTNQNDHATLMQKRLSEELDVSQ